MSRPALDRILRCKRGHQVGEWLTPDLVVIRKAGRVVVAREPISIECECGDVWKREEEQ